MTQLSNIFIQRATISDIHLIHSIDYQMFKERSFPLFVLRQYYDISADLFLVVKNLTVIWLVMYLDILTTIQMLLGLSLYLSQNSITIWVLEAN